MATEENIKKYLAELGLKPEETGKLIIEDAIQYLRFYHWKVRGVSSINFIGFSDDEVKELSNRANNCKLKVKNKLSNNVSFICLSENADPKKIEKAKSCTAIVLTQNDFEIIFDESNYKLYDNELLYDQSVPKEFRISKPLSNFDLNVEVESFSFGSENIYSVNLYQMTCACKDFEKKQRNQYLKGDIRRLCKHLIDEYKNRFGLDGLSELNRFIIENGYPVNKNFRYFSIDKIPLPVAVNFESKDDWWNIFMANENGIYFRYGYSPTEKRFSNEGKPYGFVPILRNKLDELKRQLDGNSFIKVTPKGCFYSIIIIVILCCIILYIILA